MLNKIILLVIPFILTLIPEVSLASSLSVQPLYLEFKPERNIRSKDFSINVMSEKRMNLRVSVFKAVQSLNGNLDFVEHIKKAGEKDVVTFKKETLIVDKLKPAKVEGKIHFPKKTNKTILYAVMIEENKSTVKGGVGINVRFAVILKIKTSTRKTRIASKMEVVGVENINGLNIFTAKFKNNSSKDVRVDAQVKIRGKNNKGKERATLKTGAAWKRNDDSSIVFPGAEVHLYGEIRKIDEGGEYKFSVQAKIDGRKTISASKKLSLSDDYIKKILEQKKMKNVERVTLEPSNFQIHYKGDKKSFYRFKLTNSSQKDVDLIMPDYSDKFKEMVEFSFVPNKLKLKPGKARTVLLKIKNKDGPDLKLNDLSISVSNLTGQKSIPMPISFIKAEGR